MNVLEYKALNVQYCKFSFYFIKKSAAKQFSNSIKKSFFCKPNKQFKVNVSQRQQNNQLANIQPECLKHETAQIIEFSINETTCQNTNNEDLICKNQDNYSIQENEIHNKFSIINNETYSTASKFAINGNTSVPQTIKKVLNQQISDNVFIANNINNENSCANNKTIDTNYNSMHNM